MSEIALLALGVVFVLVAASALAESLKARVPAGRSVPGVDAFAARVQGWWATAALLGLALIAGRVGVVLLFALAAFAALREFATYTAKAREDHGGLALAFFVVLPLQFLFVGMGWSGLAAVFVPVHAFLLLPVLAALRGQPERYLARVAETQWALMVCVFCASQVPALLDLPIPALNGQGVLLIAFLVLVVQGGEVVEAAAQRRLGRTRIAPALSDRTWEAAGAGVAGAAAIGLLLAWLTPFGAPGALAMGAAAGAAGLAGTLVLTAIKRERGVKDWSHLIPGQGGILDQAGGVLFAAPLFHQLAWWGWGA